MPASAVAPLHVVQFDLMAGVAVGFTVVPQGMVGHTRVVENLSQQQPSTPLALAPPNTCAATSSHLTLTSCLPPCLHPLALPLSCALKRQSYANIAGVPAVMGLYGAWLPVLFYSLFGSSRQLGVGPVVSCCQVCRFVLVLCRLLCELVYSLLC